MRWALAHQEMGSIRRTYHHGHRERVRHRLEHSPQLHGEPLPPYVIVRHHRLLVVVAVAAAVRCVAAAPGARVRRRQDARHRIHHEEDGAVATLRPVRLGSRT